jgi:hypothetical protein
MMMKWYQWVFSGIGVTLILFLYDWLKKGRFRKQSALPSTPTTQDTLLSQSVIPSPTQLQADTIIDIIESTPLLQQPEVKKHYIGIKVDWKGELGDIMDEEKGKVRMTIKCGTKRGSPYAYFVIDPKKYPGIGLLRKHDPIHFTGTIHQLGPLIDFIEIADAALVEYGDMAK